MLVFLVATYNEDAEIEDLLTSVESLDKFVISDDGSEDRTLQLANLWAIVRDKPLHIIESSHTGLPETVKKRGVEYIKSIDPDAWVLMLDADERVPEDVLAAIRKFTESPGSECITHVWFDMMEFIDDQHTRGFLKCRLFRASAAIFSESVHEDDRFEGQGANYHWIVIHRKTKEKQIMREKEYIETYKRLLAEGKVVQEWVDRCIGFHYFVKE